MLGVRFLDADFIAIKPPILDVTGYLIPFSCTVNFIGGHGGKAARNQLFGWCWIGVRDPPVGGTFRFENLGMPPLTKTCPKMVLSDKGGSLCVKEVFAKKFF